MHIATAFGGCSRHIVSSTQHLVAAALQRKSLRHRIMRQSHGLRRILLLPTVVLLALHSAAVLAWVHPQYAKPSPIKAPAVSTAAQQQRHAKPPVADQPLLPSFLWPVTNVPFRSRRRLRATKYSRNLLRVVTDVDDTIKSSGNVRLFGLIPLGGIDAQYDRGEFYPGVFQFALELALAGMPPQRAVPLPVAVLTARARELLFALELKFENPVNKGYRCATLCHQQCNDCVC